MELNMNIISLQLQDLAVRCIQRNVRKLMSVREWPWWRLYVKVAPLLNVHRTEDQLKARTVRRKHTLSIKKIFRCHYHYLYYTQL